MNVQYLISEELKRAPKCFFFVLTFCQILLVKCYIYCALLPEKVITRIIQEVHFLPNYISWSIKGFTSCKINFFFLFTATNIS